MNKLCIFIMSLCIVYGSARFIYLRSSNWTTEPLEKGIIIFCKDIIEKSSPKNILKDIGDNLNDVVDI